MTNLEKLEKEIRLKLPRLMELSEGCIIKFVMMNGKMSKRFSIHWIESDGTIYGNKGYTKISKDKAVIIGHEIQLNDVLEWVGTIDDCNFCQTADVNLLCITIFCGNIESYNACYWDLSKNLLKDQSEELINSLSELV